MQYLVDTGVWLRLFDRTDAEHANIRAAMQKLRVNGHSLAVSAQIVAEFWNVSTRPQSARGGYGKSVDVTEKRVQFIERFAIILEDSSLAYQQWRRLLHRLQVQGAAVHDCRIAALMQATGIDRILTLNDRDFRRYQPEGITIVTPASVVAS
jgi:predicted nucleic acid-binding protein